jgi:hypothetical protein
VGSKILIIYANSGTDKQLIIYEDNCALAQFLSLRATAIRRSVLLLFQNRFEFFRLLPLNLWPHTERSAQLAVRGADFDNQRSWDFVKFLQ